MPHQSSKLKWQKITHRLFKKHDNMRYPIHLQTFKIQQKDSKIKNQIIETKPFIKWVGGKRSILDTLLKNIPDDFYTYREPFLGGGALFFALQPQKAYLSDINLHLIITYKTVRDDIDKLVRNLKLYQSRISKEFYFKLRERLSEEKDPIKVATIFIALNKLCYNGLYRVNKSGKFNVPYGKYNNPTLFNENTIRNDNIILKDIDLAQHPFWQTPIVREDFYYLDPPYHNAYSKYDESNFNTTDHERLAQYCKELDKAKAYFMLSNSDTKFIRSLYSKFRIEEVKASRFISCKTNQRGKKTELIIRNY